MFFAFDQKFPKDLLHFACTVKCMIKDMQRTPVIYFNTTVRYEQPFCTDKSALSERYMIKS